jgi:hypothetical protein
VFSKRHTCKSTLLHQHGLVWEFFTVRLLLQQEIYVSRVILDPRDHIRE